MLVIIVNKKYSVFHVYDEELKNRNILRIYATLLSKSMFIV
jgi:hypothetical protein